MDGFEIFSQIAFGTPFDPKQNRRRKNKLKNYKRNQKLKFEDLNQEVELESHLGKKTNTSESSESSEEEDVDLEANGPQPIKKEKKKRKISTMQMFKIHREEVTHFRRIHKIYATGYDIPDPIEHFNQLISDYDVDPVILDNISKLGYIQPTPVQMQAIPLMLHHRQILACAPTGSGKTAAFLIPLIHKLKAPQKGGLRAVIVAPTRELSKQIHKFCVKLSDGTDLKSYIIENVNEIKENPKILKKQDILITTPNRLIYLLKNDSPLVSLKNVEWLIVDECDKLFEANNESSFREQLASIYKACDNPGCARALFSATFASDVEQWCKLSMDSLVCLAVGNKNTAVETIKQELLFVGSEGGKLLALRSFFQEGFMPPVLIFVQTKERAKDLFSEASYLCPRCDVIHSDMTQKSRDAAVTRFLSGKTWVLICTELMARGIDFKGVNLVINYDFPPTAVSYIHRIGRTGRAGEEGRAITYFSNEDVDNLKSIAQVMKNAGCEVPSYIMGLKTKKRKKQQMVLPVKRQKISTVSLYDMDNQGKRLKNPTDQATKQKKTIISRDIQPKKFKHKKFVKKSTQQKTKKPKKLQ